MFSDENQESESRLPDLHDTYLQARHDFLYTPTFTLCVTGSASSHHTQYDRLQPQF